MSVAGRVVVVTGAAAGIGAATVAQLRELGAVVVPVDREHVGDGLQVELTEQSQVAHVVPEVVRRHGRLDALVNNAGLARHSAVVDLDLGELDLMWSVNVRAVIQLTRDALRAMQPGGTVVNVVSTAGLRGEPGEAAYCATKAAVRGFTEGVSEEGRALGIRVSGVYPAGVRTGFWDRAVGHLDRLAGGLSWLTPEEVAQQIVHVLKTPAHIELPSVVVRHAGDTDLERIRAKLRAVAR